MADTEWCKACGGRGDLIVDVSLSRDVVEYQNQPCMECEGKGFIAEWEWRLPQPEYNENAVMAKVYKALESFLVKARQ